MRDEILLECKDCKECYIGTTHIDGYRCPMCGSGYLVGIGKIKELEESKKQLEIKIKSARWNGNIKDAVKRKAAKRNYIAGVDLGNDKDCTTVLNIKDNDTVIVRTKYALSIEQRKEIEETWSDTFMSQGFNNIKVIVLSDNNPNIEVLTRG